MPLGCKRSKTLTHLDKFPLTAATLPAKPVPLSIGVNWYENFDWPQKRSDGRWWIGRGPLGNIRGGHCVCVPSDAYTDADAWYEFYDQEQEGACVGFGTSRMMSHLNRQRYVARWLWDMAKATDEWSDTAPGDDNGTSVRAALEVLRVRGHVRWTSYLPTTTLDDYLLRDQLTPSVAQGISAYRWATTVTMALAALQSPRYVDLGAVPILNSWGKNYPRRVWMPLETFARLIKEDGEIGLITDR